ncbi:hypothetical protein [Isoptericola sp. NPDC057653]|uniref:hypothetical protein n=1 Tax=Isoptericola sp. NPDC057653 TaxID=3346195 RepID=UPI0036945B3C
MHSSPGASPAPGAAALAAWRPRPGRVPLAAVGSVVLVGSAALAVALSPEDDIPLSAAEVESPDYWLTGLLVGLLLGSLVALWFSVPAGAWWGAAALAAPSLGEAPGSGAFVAGLSGAVLLACIGLLATSPRRHQAAAARAWSTAPVQVPELAPTGRRMAQRWRGPWTVAGVLLVVAAVGAAALFAHDLAADRQFRATALTADGTVVEISDDGYDVVVDVDGLRISVSPPESSPAVGDVVTVRYDGSGRAELVDDPADSSILLLVSGIGIVGGPFLLLREAGRRRRVTALLTHGGPAIRLRASWDRDDEVLLAPVEAPRSPVLRTGPLAGLTPIRDHAPDALAEDDGDDADDGPYGRPVEEVTDEELLAIARTGWEDDERPADPDGPHLPPTWAGTEVLVVGLHDDRAPLALRAPDGAWYVTETGPAPARRGRRGGGRPASAGAGRIDGAVLAVVRRTGRWAPWVAVPAAATVGWWLAPGTEVWSGLVGSALVAGLLHAWSWSATAALRVTPRGLVEHGAVLDARYPWSRVAAVLADPGALVVRTRASSVEEPDALMFAVPPDGERLLPGVSDPLVARERILAARAAGAASATADTATRRRPSRPTIVAALGAAAFLLAVLAR